MDNEFSTEMMSSGPEKLFQGNMEDLQEMEKLKVQREEIGDKNISDAEKVLVEKIRRRLLHLVQRAPPMEFSAKSVPPNIRAMYQSYSVPMSGVPGTPMTANMGINAAKLMTPGTIHIPPSLSALNTGTPSAQSVQAYPMMNQITMSALQQQINSLTGASPTTSAMYSTAMNQYSQAAFNTFGQKK